MSPEWVELAKRSFAYGLEIGQQSITLETRGLRGASLAFDLAQHFPRTEISVVFDVGANVGQSAHRFNRDFPRAIIYCFEPVADTYAALVANTRDHARIQTFPLALANGDYRGPIHVPMESSLSSLLVRTDDSREETVNITSVDNFCRVNKIEHIDLLKIDTEGADLMVLEGACASLAQRALHFVQVEASFSNDDPRFTHICEFIHTLRPHGYELLALYDQMPCLGGRKSLAYFNAVFVSPELLGMGY